MLKSVSVANGSYTQLGHEPGQPLKSARPTGMGTIGLSDAIVSKRCCEAPDERDGDRPQVAAVMEPHQVGQLPQPSLTRQITAEQDAHVIGRCQVLLFPGRMGLLAQPETCKSAGRRHAGCLWCGKPNSACRHHSFTWARQASVAPKFAK